MPDLKSRTGWMAPVELCRHILQALEARLNVFFGAVNPFYHLGDLGFYFFYIMVITGTVLFFYYEPTVAGSFDQLDYLSREQWYFGGVLRSLHRYAADGMVLTVALHILREMLLGHFRGARWFSWITGVPLLVMVYLSGILGFWLVWNKLGQFIAVRTAEFLDWLPIFASPMARNFLHNSDVTNLLFRLLIVMHISIPLLLLLFMLLHVKRVSKARVMPPASLANGTLVALLLLSLFRPVLSGERADLATASNNVPIDWFYFFPYPLIHSWPMAVLWTLLAGGTLFLLLLPWLSRPPKRAVASVHLEDCSGCGYCVEDCPYEAIVMRERSVQHPRFSYEANVLEDMCVHCGICTGSCPSSNPFRRRISYSAGKETLHSGIEMPQHNIDALRSDILQKLGSLTAAKPILLFGCQHGVALGPFGDDDVAPVSLPCIGMLSPAFIEFALRKGAAGLLVSGCRQGDCYHRLGDQWLRERLSRQRVPLLHRTVDSSRIACCWQAASDTTQMHKEIDRLRIRLHQIIEN
ncbi:MAG TPA: hydrogenase iron-sulfur subunit [Gammaproteobacteria bacterium]|nr:hydrogenase iron-sulfur subunit [Gammaproteobacteria bacterium]